MTHAEPQAAKASTRIKDTVEKLLAERRDVLVTFCQVAGLEPYTADKSVAPRLRAFCELLIDYSALGHFEILDQHANDNQDSRKVAREIYSPLVDTSDAVVAFNDKYDDAEGEPDLSQLPADLSALGETLAQRIELEDRLLDTLVRH